MEQPKLNTDPETDLPVPWAIENKRPWENSPVSRMANEILNGPEEVKKHDTAEICPECGALMRKYWRPLNPMLVKMLMKIYEAIATKGENKIHPFDEMNLSTAEHMNMTQLRTHGLIAKYREDGQIKRGYWLITKRGAEFLKGNISIPKKVQVYHNRVCGHSEETVTVSDVLKSQPYLHRYEDLEWEPGELNSTPQG